MYWEGLIITLSGVKLHLIEGQSVVGLDRLLDGVVKVVQYDSSALLDFTQTHLRLVEEDEEAEHQTEVSEGQE